MNELGFVDQTDTSQSLDRIDIQPHQRVSAKIDKRPLLLCLSLGLFGIGFGTCVTAASSAILGNAPMDEAGMAASIQEVSFELGGALGIAVLGSILAAGFTHSFELPLHSRVASSEGGNVDQSLHIAKNLPAEQGAAVAAAAKEALQKAFVWVAWTGTGLLLLIAGALGISHSGFKEKSHKGLKKVDPPPLTITYNQDFRSDS